MKTGQLQSNNNPHYHPNSTMKERAQINQTSFVLDASYIGGTSSIENVQEDKKPLWLPNQKPKSKIINYKSVQGRNMGKLSTGDPNKQQWQALHDAFKTQVLHPMTPPKKSKEKIEVQTNPGSKDDKMIYYGMSNLKVGVNPTYLNAKD